MIEVIVFSVAIAIENLIVWRMAYSLGIKTEQRARLRRLNALRKLLNGKV
jgi:hypothetical protein